MDVDKFIEQRKQEYKDLVGINMSQVRVEQEKEMFNILDEDNSGFIERWEFYPYMAVRYVNLSN